MRIATLQAPLEFGITDVAVPEIGKNDVLVRVASCGVCSSELDTWKGTGASRFPVSLGHEVSGVVVNVGADVGSLRPGDPVAVWTTAGGFAEYVRVPAQHCVIVESSPIEIALGEPAGCALNSVELGKVRFGDAVVIIGAGFMGLLVQQLVLLRGPGQLIVADSRPDALDQARAFGATRVVNVATESLVDAVAETTAGAGADVLFEVTGSQRALDIAGDITKMGGRITLVGYHQGGDRTIPLSQWNWKAFDIANAHFREAATIVDGMRRAMRLLDYGRIHLDGLVTHRFGLHEITDAFEAAATKPSGFVKSIVLPD